MKLYYVKTDMKMMMIYGSMYSRMNQVNFFKGSLPQISLGPFLNTLTHIIVFDKYNNDN